MSDANTDKLKLRTAIYVDEPTTVAIRPAGESDSSALLFRYTRDSEIAPQSAIGTHELEPGIYFLMSANALEITTPGVTMHLLASDKDVPPDPKASVLASAGASPDDVQQFFAAAKGMDD